MLVALFQRDELFAMSFTFSPPKGNFATVEHRRQHAKRVRYPDICRGG
ncbi:MAG TPA: hypothetical protein VGK72_11120 [Chthoniobacterales bacterium]